MWFLTALALLLTLLQDGNVSASRSLPKNFIRCNSDDPQLNECLRKAIPDAFQKMKTDGVPSLGLFPLEPLRITEIKLDAGSPDSPINMKIDFHNMDLYGIPESTFSSVKVDVEGNTLQTITTSPKIKFTSDYVASGRMLVLPFNGKGQCNFTMYDMETKSDLKFKPEERNGETYWIIQDFGVEFRPKKMEMNFDGLFNGDKTLGDGFNAAINENWEEAFKTMKPGFEASFGQIFKEITSRVFGKVPIHKVFPKQ